MTKIPKILFLVFSIIVTVVYLASCEKYTFLDAPVIPDDPVFYSKDIQPIFNAKCVRCHSGGTLEPDLRPENSFKALTDGGYLTLPAQESELYKKGFVSISHAAYSDQTERGKILAWIMQGAENN